MRVISYMDGATKLLASWDEIRPIAGIPNSILVQYLSTKYSFEQVGVSPTAKQANFYLPLFGQGAFLFEGNLVSINGIDFAHDGISAVCPTSEASSALLDDMLENLSKDLGLRVPPPGRTRTFRSTIICDMGFEFSALFEKWNAIADFFEQLSPKSAGRLTPYSVRLGTKIGDEYTAEAAVLEMRAPRPAGENWIFSQNLLPTSAHESFLRMIHAEFRREN